MNKKQTRTYRSESLSLSPLNITLKEARVFSPPDTLNSQPNVDEELASQLIKTMKKQYRRTSPFATWMGQPFPHEYKEMVAADV